MTGTPPEDGVPDPIPGETALDEVLLRVGRLNYSWSNTESLLVHLLAGLTGMTKDAAVVVFLSVSSTKGRIELIERLAKLRLQLLRELAREDVRRSAGRPGHDQRDRLGWPGLAERRRNEASRSGRNADAPARDGCRGLHAGPSR